MNKKSGILSAVVIATFMIALYSKSILATFISLPVYSGGLKLFFHYIWWVLPVILVTGLLFGFRNIPGNLGLRKDFIKALIFALLCVSPMLISSAIIGKISPDLDLLNLFHKTLFAGFFEEFLFRGFLFGLLFMKLGWGFIPSSLLGALIFGTGHLYQGHSLMESSSIFFVTAVGAVWFAWLFIEWNHNLWIPVFLHVLMNLSWQLFEVSENALGGFYTNLFRIISIALTVIISIMQGNKKGFRINRKNLFLNNTIHA
jgi:membrane protease YdiL (CAAX protease family)